MTTTTDLKLETFTIKRKPPKSELSNTITKDLVLRFSKTLDGTGVVIKRNGEPFAWLRSFAITDDEQSYIIGLSFLPDAEQNSDHTELVDHNDTYRKLLLSHDSRSSLIYQYFSDNGTDKILQISGFIVLKDDGTANTYDNPDNMLLVACIEDHATTTAFETEQTDGSDTTTNACVFYMPKACKMENTRAVQFEKMNTDEATDEFRTKLKQLSAKCEHDPMDIYIFGRFAGRLTSVILADSNSRYIATMVCTDYLNEILKSIHIGLSISMTEDSALVAVVSVMCSGPSTYLGETINKGDYIGYVFRDSCSGIRSIKRVFKRAHVVTHDVFNSESFIKRLEEYDTVCRECPQVISPFSISIGSQIGSCKLVDDEYHITIIYPSNHILKIMDENEIHVGTKVLLKQDNDPVVTVVCGITFYVIKDDQQIPVFGCSRSPIPAFNQYFPLDKY